MSNSVAKLLIAEDEETLAFFLRQSLEEATPAFSVEVVNAGDKALNRVLRDKFDLMIVDLRLPDMDGLALIKAVRQFDPFMRVIVMTAYGSPETEREVTKLGVSGYVTKPFAIEDMKRMISQVMAEKLSFVRGLGA